MPNGRHGDGTAKSVAEATENGLRLSLLGPFALSNPAPIAIPTKKNRALLAILALSPLGRVTREQLCGLLWGGHDDQAARSNLRQSLANLRKELGDQAHVLYTEGDSIGLRLSQVFVDALCFRDLCTENDLAQLAEAAVLYRGELLIDVVIREQSFEDWLATQRRFFLDLHAHSLERLSAAGRASDRIHYAKRLVELDPLREESHRSLMSAYRDVGENGLALKQFEACRKVLRDELGVEPAQPTLDLKRQLALAAEVLDATSISSVSSDQARFSGRSRAAVAVLPVNLSARQLMPQENWARGLVQDICYKLAKLKSLHVIAADSTLSLTDLRQSPADIGALLRVDYLCFGQVKPGRDGLLVDVKLVACEDARIIWNERFEHTSDIVFELIDAVTDGIVSQLATHIELEERNRAIHLPPTTMDAWDAYHRGLWHMYHFRQTDNELARRYFQLAREKDPTFSRAYAGLSFTHWLSAYVLDPDKRKEQSRLAHNMACEAIKADNYDPAAYCALGRALWINGATDEALEALGRSTGLSPNYAFGHYSAGMISCQSGDPDFALAAFDRATALSPLDPFLCSYQGSRGLAYLRKGELDKAAFWASKSVQQPNAHCHILGVAAFCFAAAGDIERARDLAAIIRSMEPTYGSDDQLVIMHLSTDDRQMLSSLARQIGFT